MASTPDLPDQRFVEDLRQRHLEQLRTARPPREPVVPRVPWPSLPTGGGPSPFDELLEWSKQAKEQVDLAIAKRTCSLISSTAVL